ncbi:heat shock protein 70kD, peptide-binding domain-containing protein [Piromyces finnis]|uniref:Heat shock protein 70kD, peptide-binding domain-containing protein n=1 Tax=Piromyces finnis TaxID=1754191 RepID=A0A1Y1UXW6_9FUNG|nr:heat shock protein 70kD, peptide-binding domain-containing protein [Piromyces finnis]|eukprot:ORX43216.1 heat shock protein 70kD, peptide-binding domain-containing protein [Piromyces finnis]
MKKTIIINFKFNLVIIYVYISNNNNNSENTAVVYGEAIQAVYLSSSLSESIKSLNLQDVILLLLGVDSSGGITTYFIIKRNSPIPIKKTVTRVTCHDNQSSVRFRVCQGERSLVKDNTILGELTIERIIKAPRGETEFDLTFEIDKNCILNVSAVERSIKLLFRVMKEDNIKKKLVV